MFDEYLFVIQFTMTTDYYIHSNHLMGTNLLLQLLNLQLMNQLTLHHSYLQAFHLTFHRAYLLAFHLAFLQEFHRYFLRSAKETLFLSSQKSRINRLFGSA